jgi:hypothetical protein
MEHGWLHTLDSLNALTTWTPDQRAASAALWALTPAQREAAMWRRELSLLQLTEWSRRAPHEVPTINGEFAYIVIRTPEWLEAADQPRCPETGDGARECRCGLDHAKAIAGSSDAPPSSPVAE